MISSPLAKKQKLFSAACAQISTTMSSFFLNPIHNSNIISNLAGIPSDAVLIGTHDGSFHCDEVLAISMLSTLPAYKPSSNTFIVRTRNPEILEVSFFPVYTKLLSSFIIICKLFSKLAYYTAEMQYRGGCWCRV